MQYIFIANNVILINFVAVKVAWYDVIRSILAAKNIYIYYIPSQNDQNITKTKNHIFK
jgi:hypothetical protein